MSSLLVTPRGEPAPPQDIESRLRAISPRLSLKYLPGPTGGWAIMLSWSDVDRRRITVREGLTAEEDARDMLTMLPLDCSVEAAESYFVNACRTGYGGSNKEEVHKLLDGMHRWNAEQAERNAAPLMDYADELIRTNAKTLFKDEGKTMPKFYQTVSKHIPKRKTESL